MQTPKDYADFIWEIAELLRGDYKRSDYGKVILPLTVLRRLDCTLEKTRKAVLDALPSVQDKGDRIADRILNRAAGYTFHNRSKYDFATLLNDSTHIAANLTHFINGFSGNIREILEYFSFADQITRLDKADLLYQIVSKFSTLNLHPERVKNEAMGAIFEDLIRRFAEQSNETAGEHFTPREVIHLMVDLLFLEDREILSKSGIVRTLYDPACGTGGMLSIAEDYLHQLNPGTPGSPGGKLELFGQEINPESYAICKSDMVIKGHNAGNIKFGNSFTLDGLEGETFDYMLSNPPFGVEWKKVEKQIRDEHDAKGYAGRFGAGLPRISDGSFLFLQHMLAKRKDGGDGTRIALVFNGSPLFSGGAGSGESEIRRWIIEHDWLEGIIALPDQLFYNTGISTYVWIVTSRKSEERQGKVQLVNAVSFSQPMKKSLGNKRKRIGDGADGRENQIAQIVQIYGGFASGPQCKIFDNTDFGFRRITVERPLRLNFQISAERIARIEKLTLPVEVKTRTREALRKHVSDTVYPNASTFLPFVRQAFVAEGVSPPSQKQLRLLLEKALGERDENAEKFLDDDGGDIPDADLRDFENVPLKEDIDDYFAREVLPHVPDAWINTSKRDEDDGRVGIVGYEIPFTRHFYDYKPLRPLDEIEAEILGLETQIQGLLREALK